MSGKVVKSNTYKNKLKLISLVCFDSQDNFLFCESNYLRYYNRRETIYCDFSKIFIAIKNDIAKLYELSKLA